MWCLNHVDSGHLVSLRADHRIGVEKEFGGQSLRKASLFSKTAGRLWEKKTELKQGKVGIEFEMGRAELEALGLFDRR